MLISLASSLGRAITLLLLCFAAKIGASDALAHFYVGLALRSDPVSVVEFLFSLETFVSSVFTEFVRLLSLETRFVLSKLAVEELI